MNWYERLRFVAKSSRSLRSEHMSTSAILHFPKVTLYIADRNVPFAWAHNILYFSDSKCSHLALLWSEFQCFSCWQKLQLVLLVRYLEH